jgi:CHAD domain-containing protein
MAIDIARLEQSVSRLDKFLKKAPKNPTPKKIHDVRTSTRKLESALESLTIRNKAAKKRLLRDLPVIRKRCGKVRDMDVLTGHAITVKLEDGEQDCLIQVLERLGATRVKYAKRLRQEVKRCAPQIRRDLARVEKTVQKLDRAAKNRGAVPDTQTTGMATEMAAELHNPAHLNHNNLHPYRLKVKQLRYVLQLSQEAQHDRFVAVLGEVKDCIGEWHDWGELVAIASDLLSPGPQCKFVQQLKRIAGEKFEKALAITNKMRATYVHGQRHGRGPGKGRTVPFSVVVAQAAARANA